MLSKEELLKYLLLTQVAGVVSSEQKILHAFGQWGMIGTHGDYQKSDMSTSERQGLGQNRHQG